MVSVLGGAELERYLLPVLPLLYIAMGAALSTLRPMWRNAGLVTVAAGLLIGLFVNPPYPFPFENNLAMVDFVELHRDAARYLEASYPNQTIYTAWPLTGALRDPAFGYVTKKLATFETSDLGYSTLNRLDPKGVDVLVLVFQNLGAALERVAVAPSRAISAPLLPLRAANERRPGPRTFRPGPSPPMDAARPVDRDLRPLT